MKRSAASRVLQALGDPQRLAIVEHLIGAPRSVQYLADRLPISRPAVSRHRRVLKNSRFVTSEARGTRRIYRLRPDGLEELRDYLEHLWGEAQKRFVITGENTKPKR